MDLYSPAKLKSMGHKQLQEARADIMQEISDLEAVRNRSSVQEVGLRNLHASLEIASDILAERGDGSLRLGSGGTGGSNLEFPGGSRLPTQRRTDSDQYTTFLDSRGNTLYAAGPNQRLTDVPGVEQFHSPRFMGALMVAAVTGRRDGLEPDLRAALSGGSLADGGITVPEARAPWWVDLARATSVLNVAGMQSMMTGAESVLITRVTSDPTLSLKLENEKFSETSMTFGGLTVYTRGVGFTLIASHDLLENGANITNMIDNSARKATALGVDQYGITGSGAGNEPGGILSYTTAGYEIADTPVATAAFGWESISAAVLEIENRNHVAPVAIMSPTRLHALLQQKDGEERWLGRPETLANVRFIASTQVPSDRVIVGDFSNFLMVVRNDIRLDFSDHAGEVFERRQRMFRMFLKLNYICLDVNAFQTLTITA